MVLLRKIQLLAIVLAAVAFSAGGHDSFAAPVDAGKLELELVAQGEAVPGSEVYVALRQKIDPEWHTFWRNPGDAGEATKLVWTLPAGWQAGDIVWPVPDKYTLGPLMNYVFSGDVILPTPIKVPASAVPGSTVNLKAEAVYQVCSDVCIPGQTALTLDIRVAGGAPAKDATWFEPIAKVVGEAPKPAGLTAASTVTDGKLRIGIVGEPLKGADLSKAYFYPFSSLLIDHAAAQAVERGPDGLTMILTPAAPVPGRAAEIPAGVISLGDRAFEVAAPAGAAIVSAGGQGLVAQAGSGPVLPLWQAVVFAFVGGLILNLMPCVFPVLSMKAASLALHAHEARKARIQGLAFTAGCVVTFLALAGALIAAKAAGSAVGWGFQLQSPPVIAALCLLMVLIALNLSGLFEIGVSAQGVGSGLADRDGLAGAFFTGALAVVVAAPCTAPFMAAALGYALAQPAVISLGVFAALGLGFALPFTALAFSPGLLRRLPRPGAWMSIFKAVLAFPMFGAAAWLAWVFTMQAGPTALAFLLGAALLTAFGAWLFGLGQLSTRPVRRVVLQIALPVALIASGLLLAPVAKTAAAPAADEAVAADEKAAVPYEAFTPDRLAALRAEGKPVFINFTAAWCVSCQANELTSLSSKSVADTFSRTGVVYLKGDWTNRDAVIAKVLAEHGVAGVPLYLVYPRGGGEPVKLPQLLTPGIVKSALEKAAA